MTNWRDIKAKSDLVYFFTSIEIVTPRIAAFFRDLIKAPH